MRSANVITERRHGLQRLRELRLNQKIMSTELIELIRLKKRESVGGCSLGNAQLQPPKRSLHRENLVLYAHDFFLAVFFFKKELFPFSKSSCVTTDTTTKLLTLSFFLFLQGWTCC